MSGNAPNTQKMKFNKTETEYNMKSIRFLLLTITTMFIVIAGLMIVLGISVYTYYHNFSFFYESGKGGRLLTPSILCVIFGMILLVVTMFGFFGSLKQSTCMVNLYALILGVLVILKVIVIILSLTIDATTLHNLINIPIAEYTSDDEIRAEIDLLQTSLNCCGDTSYHDYLSMNFTSDHSTVIISNSDDGPVLVPSSCCVVKTEDDAYCMIIRTNGCRTVMGRLLLENSSVIGILGISVTFIQVLGIIFALLLARCIRKMKSERALQQWKIKEQMIMARKAEENLSDGNTVYIAQADSSTA
ncbi:CD63 antigen-like [Leptidea sinapis]|uniref:CD63 antigen-like n=1 Tax=Leptidea sinapis TaxID=189913 RepID=UPI00214341CF|nr:CD63 antigen-like [Leptidea sinapis]